MRTISLIREPLDYGDIKLNADIFKDTREKLAQRVIDTKDRLIKDAITFVLGREDWTIEKVKDRCLIEYIGNKQYFSIDGKQMIVFIAPDLKLGEGASFNLLSHILLYKGEEE
jgi:hypothetical protein